MIDKKLFDEVELQNAQSKALLQHKVQALNEEIAKFQALQQEHAALEESFRQPAPPPVDPMAEVDAYLNQAPQRAAEEPAPVVAPPQDTSEVEAPKATSTRHKAVNPGLYKSVIEGLASKYDIPSKLLMSVVHSESGFNPNATSSAGAIGLMQLMPGTARDLGVDPTDPMQNLEGGTRYLKQQLDRFGSVPLALAAYNAGPGAVKKYGGVPPFKETRDYVDKVMEGAGKYADGGLVELYQKYEDGGKAALSPDKVKQIIADEKQFAKNWFAERDLLPFNKAIMAYNLNQDNPIEYRDVIDNDPTTLAQTEGKKIILTPGADENAVREETEHTARDWAIPTRLYDAGVYQGNRKTLDQYTKDFKSGNIKGTYPADTDIYQMYAYLNKPEEGHARLMELRRLAKFNPKQKISQEDLDNFYKNYDKKSHRVNQLLDMTNDTGLIEMLNYMSKNDSRPDKQELINALTNKNYA